MAISLVVVPCALTVLLVPFSTACNRTTDNDSLWKKDSGLAVITAETVKAPAKFNVSENIEKALTRVPLGSAAMKCCNVPRGG